MISVYTEVGIGNNEEIVNVAMVIEGEEVEAETEKGSKRNGAVVW